MGSDTEREPWESTPSAERQSRAARCRSSDAWLAHAAPLTTFRPLLSRDDRPIIGGYASPTHVLCKVRELEVMDQRLIRRVTAERPVAVDSQMLTRPNPDLGG